MVKQSSELTGGTGFHFEELVAATYMGALIAETSAQALGDRIVQRVALQQASFGEPLDDLIVDAQSDDGETSRCSLQVKRSLTVSSAKTNSDFREIIINSWKTLQKEDFKEGVDRYGAAVGTISEASYRKLQDICEWARDSADAVSFTSRFSSNGNASQAHKTILAAINDILGEHLGEEISNERRHNLLRHFVITKFDFLHEGATSPNEAIERIRCVLSPNESARASDLWSQLVVFAHDGSGRSATFKRDTLIVKLAGRFRFTGSSFLQTDLNLMKQHARHCVDDITPVIDGFHINRDSLIGDVEALLDKHRFIQIKGLPGSGKSVVLRQLVNLKLDSGAVLFIKSDRISGSNWMEYTHNIGLGTHHVEKLLVEIMGSGTPILFVDGIDRIEPSQQKVVLDLLNAIYSSSLLTSWKVIVTSRDSGIEPLRNWLPESIFQKGGVGTFDIKLMNDEEAEALSNAKPALRPLLFGELSVRNIARRPFFASVLAKGFSDLTMQRDFSPRTEVDLAKAWWVHGGYDAQPKTVHKRQRALMDMANHAANKFGFIISTQQLASGTTDLLHELTVDGIIHETKAGLRLRFSHDIFFEWAYFYYLLGQEERWIDALIKAGEPPALGRVIELASQAQFSSDTEWLSSLYAIEKSSIRSQWQRAWLLGPFGSSCIIESGKNIETAVFQDDYARLHKLMVWFQAEKTIPNPFVLDGQLISSELSRNEIIRIADSLGFPADFQIWQRFLNWTLDHVDGFPVEVLPDVVTNFEVWQSALADYSNSLSKLIISKCFEWLTDIEDRRYSEGWKHDYGKWDILDRDDLKAVEGSLRGIVLRSVRSIPEVVRSYLDRIQNQKRLRHSVFPEIIQHSLVLSQKLPDELIQLTLTELMKDLPEDVAKRRKEEKAASRSQFYTDHMSFHGWDHLAMGWDHGEPFYPASPLREPFKSLFDHAPKKALLLIRQLSNHAITSWLQLHKLSHDGRGTPLPIILELPWGTQEFWGDWPQYVWFRGWLGPKAVESGLMALEHWAFKEIENGRDIDEVLQDILEGHQCWSVLGIASAITIETKHVSKITLSLIGCQRLWGMDIRRQINDQTGLASNLMGFGGLRGPLSSDMQHINAIRKGNQRKCRSQSIRDITPLFVWRDDDEIRRSSRSLLEQFPDSLPFAYEEEKNSVEHVNKLRSTAEIWAEWGKFENYVATPVSEGGNRLMIQLENPMHKKPEVQEEVARSNQKSKEYSLWNWVEKTFKEKSLSESLSLDDATQFAKEFDRPDCFQNRVIIDNNTLLLGAIAGTAAAVLCFSVRDDLGMVSWAEEVISRALETVETEDTYLTSGALIPWHPCVFVAKALASEVRLDSNNHSAKEKLLVLIAHPLEVVSLEALQCAFECWGADDRYAWTALDLGMQLSVGSRKDGVQSAYGYDPADEMTFRTHAVLQTLDGYFDNSEFANLTAPPKPWEFGPVEGDSNEPCWYKPNEYWRWDFAPKVLKLAPVDNIMGDLNRREQFLQLCDALLTWTFETINPSWKGRDSFQRDEREANLIEWMSELSHLLVRISGYLDAKEIYQRYLTPIFEQDDGLCFSMLSSYVGLYIASYIIDAKAVMSDRLQLLDCCLDRTLKASSFDRSGSWSGRVNGFDTPKLINDFFFVSIESESEAARFANGTWDEIEIVLPLVDKFIRHAGWNSSVMNAYLKLCEKCGSHYPSAAFADQTLLILEGGYLPGWRGTILPARIAGLVQFYTSNEHALEYGLAQKMLKILDVLVDLGDRRSASLQASEVFRDVRLDSGLS